MDIYHQIKHMLPSQGPLKDFIHHNTLHAFQHLPFHEGLALASQLHGCKTYLSEEEYAQLSKEHKIDPQFLSSSLKAPAPETTPTQSKSWLRQIWKSHFQINLDNKIHPHLFRLLCSFLDQGIAMSRFPATSASFLEAVRKLDQNSLVSIFPYSSARARKLLQNPTTQLEDVLKLIVGDSRLYDHYLFDQQLAHPGWSGLVCAIEDQPESLLEKRKISLKELVFFESLLELDYLDFALGENRKLLSDIYSGPSLEQVLKPKEDKSFQRLAQWQEGYEKTYYNSVLRALKNNTVKANAPSHPCMQAIFCIDDRESSLRTYLENQDICVETFATPGFFGVEFFYQPENSFHFTKLCPAPMTPKYLIKQSQSEIKRKKDFHLESHSHSLFGGWLIAQTLGFWSAVQLFFQIFRPSLTPATATSLRHMDKVSQLTIENEHTHHHEHGLQIGFTIDEMADRVYGMLNSIGLTKHFADLVYLVGHGSSSNNNPHYAAYDCGACSGRPGSVNARVFAHMANHEKVREKLELKGLSIPRTTLFVGALHDTTRDEIEFFEEKAWPLGFRDKHQKNISLFNSALDLNSQERSRRFINTPTNLNPKKYNRLAKLRSVSLFEPRPELNHATNALCIVGRRALTRGVFWDRRAFLNSYDAAIDPEGEILTRILNAAVPVCGGINLEYYFSRVDNQKLGAGTKLPYNVMGLIGVANGTDGDLRPGLPSQMIEVHDPLRLLIVAEHSHDVVLKSVQRNPATFEWIQNEWVRLASIHPQTKEIHLFEKGQMNIFIPQGETPTIDNLTSYVKSSRDNLAVGFIKEAK